MAVPCSIVIASVNMHKRNTVTHALLNSDNNTNIFLLQEPWFDTIGTACKDTACQGVDMLGGIASHNWEVIYPNIPTGAWPNVMAYNQQRASSPHNHPHFTLAPCLNVSSHPCLQVLNVIFNEDSWWLVNFYHDIRDGSSLKALLSLDLNMVIPTMVIGDFNTHSPTWSLPNNPRSRWANQIEEWAAANLLLLANNPGEITQRGMEHEQDSVIDLAWYNAAVVQ